MREYRGKRIDNGEWVYGWYLLDEQWKEPRHCIYFRKNTRNIIGHDIVEVDPDTVGQYIGQRDCNDKQIFDGDIATGEHATYLIYWREDKAQYMAKVIKTTSVLIRHNSFPLWQYIEDNDKCRFEVIGNRWDHPHLLGEVTEK
jgi:YopX protein.